jgi:outer membrane protein assembly factor BamB
LATGGVVAIDPQTGQKKWKFAMHDVNTSGILTTGTDLLFVGGREGYFQALDARTGTLLWKENLGGDIIAGPISFLVDGKQYITITAGNSLFAFGLGE